MYKYCDRCKIKCKKTLYGMFTLLCKENKILCMDCNQFRLFATKKNILKYLRNREISYYFS